MCYWPEDKHTDQWNRIENPETRPLHRYGKPFWTEVQKQFRGGRTLLSINGAVAVGHL